MMEKIYFSFYSFLAAGGGCEAFILMTVLNLCQCNYNEHTCCYCCYIGNNNDVVRSV